MSQRSGRKENTVIILRFSINCLNVQDVKDIYRFKGILGVKGVFSSVKVSAKCMPVIVIMIQVPSRNSLPYK